MFPVKTDVLEICYAITFSLFHFFRNLKIHMQSTENKASVHFRTGSRELILVDLQNAEWKEEPVWRYPVVGMTQEMFLIRSSVPPGAKE